MSFNCIQEHHDLLLSTLPAVESALEVCLLIFFLGGCGFLVFYLCFFLPTYTFFFLFDIGKCCTRGSLMF